MAICISYDSIPSLNETVKRVQISEDGCVMWVTLSDGKTLISQFFDTDNWRAVKESLPSHVIVDDQNKIEIELEAGQHYWVKAKQNSAAWQVWYVGLDSDDNKWVHQIGVDPILLSQMSLDVFEFKKANPEA